MTTMIDDPLTELAWPPRAPCPLAELQAELAELVTELGCSAADPDGSFPIDALRRVRVHLALASSLLLPMWRQQCTDHAEVDRHEVRTALLRALADATAAAPADDPLAQARLAVLAEGLARYRQRAVVQLRALEIVIDTERLAALRADWRAQRDTMLRTLSAHPKAEFENEDADPVGAVAH